MSRSVAAALIAMASGCGGPVTSGDRFAGADSVEVVVQVTPPAVPVGETRDCGAGEVAGRRVSGIVVDSLTGFGLDSTRVYASRCSVYTDPEGRFMIAGLPSDDSLSMFVVKEGYQAFDGTVVIPPDSVLRLILAPNLRCDPSRHPSLPRVETTDSAVVLNLTPPLDEALQAAAPDFTPQPLSDFLNSVERSYRYSCYQAPSAVIGDFNGDGVDDLVAYGVSRETALGVVLISTPDGYRSSLRSGRIEEMHYLVRTEPGTYLEGGDDPSITLENQGVRETGEMYRNRVIYYQDGEIRIWDYPVA